MVTMRLTSMDNWAIENGSKEIGTIDWVPIDPDDDGSKFAYRFQGCNSYLSQYELQTVVSMLDHLNRFKMQAR